MNTCIDVTLFTFYHAFKTLLYYDFILKVSEWTSCQECYKKMLYLSRQDNLGI